LRQAAVEFEANFLQELLKPMKEDPLFAGKDGSGGDDGEIGGSLGTIDSMGTQAMAEALANAGGLGIARQVLARMAPIEAANAAAKAAHTAAAPQSSGKQCGGCAVPLTIGAGNKADAGLSGTGVPTGMEKPGTRLLPR
jgi:Rod binding domain-containing protein